LSLRTGTGRSTTKSFMNSLIGCLRARISLHTTQPSGIATCMPRETVYPNETTRHAILCGLCAKRLRFLHSVSVSDFPCLTGFIWASNKTKLKWLKTTQLFHLSR
jgi:hypothetical protein